MLDPVKAPEKWGLWDAQAELWLGDVRGPALFDDFDLANIAAAVASIRLDTPVAVRGFADGPVRLKDEVATRLDPVSALKELERGESKKARHGIKRPSHLKAVK